MSKNWLRNWLLASSSKLAPAAPRADGKRHCVILSVQANQCRGLSPEFLGEEGSQEGARACGFATAGRTGEATLQHSYPPAQLPSSTATLQHSYPPAQLHSSTATLQRKLLRTEASGSAKVQRAEAPGRNKVQLRSSTSSAILWTACMYVSWVVSA